jgi:Uma2 family endonuclease
MRTKRWAGCFTYDDFCALIHEDQKADLIDGMIYMTSPENIDANDLFSWLIIIRSYTDKKKLGCVFGSRVVYHRLDDRNTPEPAILFVRNQCSDCLHRGDVEAPPERAIEIVSPESVERDYEKKRKQYQRFGVSEYWIIDEEEKTILQLRLNRRGRYTEVRPRHGMFHSKVLPGFFLDPNWLWQKPRPFALDIAQQVIAGSSGK